MITVNEDLPVDLVCFSDIFWDALWQRHQNILVRLPDNWRVLYLEPTSVPVLLKEPKRLFSRSFGRITIVSIPAIPLVDKMGLRYINDLLVQRWLKWIFKGKSISNPILLFYEPRFSTLMGRLGERLTVYDCVDDKLAFSKVPSWIADYIDSLLKRADLVLVTSKQLGNMASKHRSSDLFLVGNGVDVDLFRTAREDIPRPDDLSGIKGPIIGYIGMIDEWMDFDLLQKLSSSRPDVSLVLIGPVNIGREISSIRRLNNVHILGKRPYSSLPAYLSAFDVCIIPFKVNRLTCSVNPVKVYEYLAAGKRVVATNLPELLCLSDLVSLAKNDLEFLGLVDEMLCNPPSSDYLTQSMSIALNNSWDKKADLVVSHINESLRKGK